jgi:hypothetical protein
MNAHAASSTSVDAQTLCAQRIDASKGSQRMTGVGVQHVMLPPYAVIDSTVSVSVAAVGDAR